MIQLVNKEGKGEIERRLLNAHRLAMGAIFRDGEYTEYREQFDSALALLSDQESELQTLKARVAELEAENERFFRAIEAISGDCWIEGECLLANYAGMSVDQIARAALNPATGEGEK